MSNFEQALMAGAGTKRTMPTAYHFAINKNGATEVLGATPLADDAEAISFGNDIIRDLMRESACAGFTLVITSGEARKRAVSSIPFDPQADPGGRS